MARSRAAVSTGLAAPKMDAKLGGAAAATDRLMGAAAAGISATGALFFFYGDSSGFQR